MSEHKIPIPSMIYNAAVGGHVTNSQQIIDENLNREQQDINEEVAAVPYNTSNPNGMGKIVLKKTDNFKQVVEAQTNGNTIFIIKYDFTLTGDVTIPANCVLEFDGGSISGSYILTGTNTHINAGLIKIFNTNVTLAGTWDVDIFDIRWFGVVANDKTINCTPIIEKIYSFGKIHFPVGTFYLSPLHIVNTRENPFYIEGELSSTVYPKTIFKPYTTTQSYIIKAGGSANKLDGYLNANRAYNIDIINIGFKSDDNYNPTNLTSEYNGTADYYFGALILDKVEVGHFAIYGSGLANTPLLVMGYSYECHFDFITAYGHGAKNDMPLVYIINDQKSGVSATYIDRMMCEVCFGPIIKTSTMAASAEFIINFFMMEGTCTWENDILYSDAEPNWDDYNIIPIFELYNNINFQVNFMSLTRSNTIWDNPKDVSSKHNIRTLLNAKNLLAAFIVLDNVYNNGQSPYQYIIANTTNIGYENYLKIKGTGIKVCKDSTSSMIYLDIDETHTDRNNRSSLIIGKKYYGKELKKLYNPLGIENVGVNCFFSNVNYLDEGYETIHIVRNKSTIVTVNPILNKDGFYVKSDYLILGINAEGSGYSNWRTIELQYKNSNGDTISTYSREDRFYGRKIHNYIIKLDKSITYDHIVLHYPDAYYLNLYFILATNDISEYVNTSGTFANKPSGDIVKTGFRYFCTDKPSTPGSPIFYTGNSNTPWVYADGKTVS